LIHHNNFAFLSYLANTLDQKQSKRLDITVIVRYNKAISFHIYLSGEGEPMKRALMTVVASVLAVGVFLGAAAQPAQAAGYAKKAAYHPVKKVMKKKVYRHKYTYKKASYHVHFSGTQAMVPMTANTEGKILVTWAARGGTCNFAYTEADQTVYKYKSSTGCDGGMYWIGGLEPGKSYKVTMAQENWMYWQRPQVARAISMAK
jgi:hypothetical protein